MCVAQMQHRFLCCFNYKPTTQSITRGPQYGCKEVTQTIRVGDGNSKERSNLYNRNFGEKLRGGKFCIELGQDGF
jgi:hypothetical protein